MIDKYRLWVLKRKIRKLAVYRNPSFKFLSRDTLNSLGTSTITMRKVRNPILHRTSGSSGVPLDIMYNRIEYMLKDLDFLYAYLLGGLNPFLPIVALRDPVDIKEPNIVQKLGLFRHFYLCVFDDIEKNIDALVSNFSNRKIVLKGHASDLYALAQFSDRIHENNIRVSLVISDSEVLEDYMYECLRLNFTNKILATYSCVEIGYIGQRRYWLEDYYKISRKVKLDIVEHESGLNSIVLTNLRFRQTCLFYKYQIGDYTLDGPKENVRQLSNITGKLISVLYHANGNPVSGHLIKQELANKIDGLMRFQVVQDSRNNVIVNYTPKYGWNTDVIETKIKQIMADCLGQETVVRVVNKNLLERSTRKFQVILKEM